MTLHFTPQTNLERRNNTAPKWIKCDFEAYRLRHIRTCTSQVLELFSGIYRGVSKN